VPESEIRTTGFGNYRASACVVSRMVPISLAAVDWNEVRRSLDAVGWARLPRILTAVQCAELRALYPDARRFRSTIDMARHRFGEGEYRYFRRPLPRIVQKLRAGVYPQLAPLANAWAERSGRADRYPPTLARFLALCSALGQTRPTPLLLRYQAGGYNCLHRDLYGEVAFPLQLTVFLSRPGADYEGGAFLLVEQRPRQQSRGEALVPGLGEAVVFATAERPVAGSRGFFRAGMRHGVATITRGERYTLGVIFHDAK
jgi:hypothetical protein